MALKQLWIVGVAIMLYMVSVVIIYSTRRSTYHLTNQADTLDDQIHTYTDYSMRRNDERKPPSHDEVAKRRLPNAIIGGCAKCGTRALLWMLSLHPAVVNAGPETHFFDRDENYHKGLEWYLKFFPPRRKDQIGIEKTPGYWFNGKAPQRIYKMDPSVKLILLCVSRFLRQFRDFHSRGFKITILEKRYFIQRTILLIL